ncbi:MAG: DUF3459 domain-containing protein [Phycisphaerae bacterium]|nr:DUF3459 domain-containing protein [Phycisphaerae bacterium]
MTVASIKALLVTASLLGSSAMALAPAAPSALAPPVASAPPASTAPPAASAPPASTAPPSAPAAPRGVAKPAFPPDLEIAIVPKQLADRPGPLPPSVSVSGRSSKDPSLWRVSFACSAGDAGAAKSMSVAGSFNGWSTTRTPMHRNETLPPRAASKLPWISAVELPDGEHLYKFVADGSRWFHDLQNVQRVPDGHGGFNSVLRLGVEANLDASKAERGDGRIEFVALGHDSTKPRDRQRLGADCWLIRARTLAGDVESVELARSDGGGAGALAASAASSGSTPLRRVARQGPFEWWETEITAAAPLRYTFVFKDGDRRVRDPRIYELDPSEKPGFTTPDWARDAIWYQVMVDRFRNGDPKNDPEPVRPWRSEWEIASPWEGRDGQTFFKHFVFDRLYGGDIAGLRQALPYLKQLGANALYLMPVFQAQGPHKYNGRSYIHIDEHFGTKGDYAVAEAKEDLLDPSTWTWTESDRAFLDFVKQAKSMGFRVIVDGVFNHTGTDHPAFRDVRDRRQKSRFADWYEIKSWEPFDYEGWWGHKSLPVFRKDDTHGLASESLRKHIFDATRRWMDPDGDGDPSDGIDGWRLDVPNEVPMPFWREWCKLVKQINPDAYISGEIWTRAEQWLDGTAFDAVMNYEFAKPAVAWVANREQKLTVSELDERLAALRLAYPNAATQVMQNLVDSHDTDRVSSMMMNPDRPYNERNREQEGHRYDSSRPDAAHQRRQQVLALLQMTYVGAPMVFYGDEAGMWGAGDPGNRKPMLWKDLEPYDNAEENFVDEWMLDFYRGAMALRRDHSALRRGSFRTLVTDDEQDLWVFLRDDDREQVLVALNASDRAAAVTLPAELGTGWRAVFGEAEGPEGDPSWPRVEIPPTTGRVWAKSK